jgi:hypothetical protein
MFFFFFVFYETRKLFLNLWFFFEFFWEKLGIFNIRFVSYSISLQPDIKQNVVKTHEAPINNFKMVPEFFQMFFFENFKGLFG